jgi:hypothetical protein
MILDAGCGNRSMWLLKNNDRIIYVDVEKQLQRKPTIFSSNTNLPFSDNSFDSIFFDPPFSWNMKHPFWSFPNINLQLKAYPNIDAEHNKYCPTYYGVERYKNRSALVSYIYRAEKELYRVLKDDGSLWLRWANMSNMSEQHVLGIFKNWHICLTHEINTSRQNTAMRKVKENNISFWFMLMKKPLQFVQPDLFAVTQEPIMQFNMSEK